MEQFRHGPARRARLLVEADDVKAARSKSTIGALLDKWASQHDIDETTRDSYASLIRLYIRPALGDIALTLFMRNPAERLETFYAELRRCRADCKVIECRPHICKPFSAASVRRIIVLSAAFAPDWPVRSAPNHAAGQFDHFRAHRCGQGVDQRDPRAFHVGTTQGHRRTPLLVSAASSSWPSLIRSARPTGPAR